MKVLVLLIAFSIDVFVASVACGMSKIRIKPLPALCITAICSGILAFSLCVGTFLDGKIDERYTTKLCFIGLFVVGAVKISEYCIKKYVEKHERIRKRIRLKLKYFNLIINIYNNPVTEEISEMSQMTEMSISESIFFALAMSIDGLFGGIGAAFFKINIPFTILCNFIIGFILIIIGQYLGTSASRKWNKDLSWISGALFILLAFWKIL